MKTFGIDVSLYQNGLDFAAAKAEGVKYVIVKCSEGTFTDPLFENHYAAAKKAGLGVGAYHYLGSKTVEGVKKEAKYCLSVIKGKQFEYPIFLDVEGSYFDGVSVADLTKLVRTFCEIVESAGYWVGFYTNLDWYLHRLDGASLAQRFSLWCAAWMNSCPCQNAQMWQFGGSVNLIRQNTVAGVVCDQDYAFVDFPTLIKNKGLNGYGKTPAPTPTPTPAPAPKPKPEPIKVGDACKLSPDATVYGTSQKFLDFVYQETVYVRELNGNRAVISIYKDRGVTGATDVKYLTRI